MRLRNHECNPIMILLDTWEQVCGISCMFVHIVDTVDGIGYSAALVEPSTDEVLLCACFTKTLARATPSF